MFFKILVGVTIAVMFAGSWIVSQPVSSFQSLSTLNIQTTTDNVALNAK